MLSSALRRNVQWQQHDIFDNRHYRVGFGNLGKGWIEFVGPQLEDCLTGLTGSSTQAGTGCTHLQLIDDIVADCQTLTSPKL